MNQPQPKFDDEFLTVQEVMAALRCGRGKVYSMLRSGELHAIKIGNLTRISKSSLRKLIQSSEYRSAPQN